MPLPGASLTAGHTSKDEAVRGLLQGKYSSAANYVSYMQRKGRVVVAVKIQGDGLGPESLLDGYPKLVDDMVSTATKGEYHVSDISARQGCVLVSMDVMPVADQHGHSAADLCDALTEQLLQALGMEGQATDMVMHVHSQLDQQAAALVRGITLLQPFVVHPSQDAGSIHFTADLHHPLGESVSAYTPDPAHGSADGASGQADADDQQHLSLAVRCGTEYVAVQVTTHAAGATSTRVEVVATLPACWQGDRAVGVELWHGVWCVSKAAVYCAPRTQHAGSGLVAADLQRLQEGGDAASARAFLTDLCYLQDMLGRAEHESSCSRAGTERPRHAEMAARVTRSKQEFACDLASQLAFYACSQGCRATAEYLVTLHTKPGGHELLGAEHWLAAIPAAKEELQAAAAASGDQALVHAVQAWVEDYESRAASSAAWQGEELAAGDRITDTAGGSAVGDALLKTGSKLDLIEAEASDAAVALQKAAQQQWALGSAGLARAVLLGFRNQALESAFLHQHATWSSNTVCWLMIMLARLSSICQVLLFAAQQLGFPNALVLVLPVTSLLAAGTVMAVQGKMRGSMPQIEAGVILVQLAFTVIFMPVGMGWVQVTHPEWVASCVRLRRVTTNGVFAAVVGVITAITDQTRFPSWLLITLGINAPGVAIVYQQAGDTLQAATRSSLIYNSTLAVLHLPWCVYTRWSFVKKLKAHTVMPSAHKARPSASS